MPEKRIHNLQMLLWYTAESGPVSPYFGMFFGTWDFDGHQAFVWRDALVVQLVIDRG